MHHILSSSSQEVDLYVLLYDDHVENVFLLLSVLCVCDASDVMNLWRVDNCLMTCTQHLSSSIPGDMMMIIDLLLPPPFSSDPLFCSQTFMTRSFGEHHESSWCPDRDTSHAHFFCHPSTAHFLEQQTHLTLPPTILITYIMIIKCSPPPLIHNISSDDKFEKSCECDSLSLSSHFNQFKQERPKERLAQREKKERTQWEEYENEGEESHFHLSYLIIVASLSYEISSLSLSLSHFSALPSSVSI